MLWILAWACVPLVGEGGSCHIKPEPLPPAQAAEVPEVQAAPRPENDNHCTSIHQGLLWLDPVLDTRMGTW